MLRVSAEQRGNVSALAPEDTISTEPENAGDTLSDLMDSSVYCAYKSPLSSTEGGVVFIFTDIDCEVLKQSHNLNFTTAFTSLIVGRFTVQIMYLSHDDNVNATTRSCLTEVFHNCPYPSCTLGVYGAINNTMQSCTSDMTTCAAQPAKDSSLSTTEFVIIIAVLCVCITLVCSVCAVLLYKKMKMKNRKWNTFWMSQRNQDGNDALPTGNYANANQYLDIRAMAAANLKDSWEVELKNVTVHENMILGNGAFATVYKGTLKGKVPLLINNATLNLNIEHMDNGQCEAAVKRLPAHADEQSRLDFFHEIDFMKKLGYHSHVISMLCCVSNPWDPLLLIEFCHYGDLLRFLRSHREHVLESDDDVCPIDIDICLRIKDLVSFAWQVSDGMMYLSSQNYIHRDLAARNIFLTKNLVAKVGDFGLCRYNDSALYTAKGGRLPIKWMAIESLKYYEYSVKSDVWSFAILLFELFSMGDGPFQAIQPLEMVDHLERGNRLPQPSRCPNEIYSLMQRCWDKNPNERPCFTEIRKELKVMLNVEAEHYGYLSLEPRPGDLLNMMEEEVTKHERSTTITSIVTEHSTHFDLDALTVEVVAPAIPERPPRVLPWRSNTIKSECICDGVCERSEDQSAERQADSAEKCTCSQETTQDDTGVAEPKTPKVSSPEYLAMMEATKKCQEEFAMDTRQNIHDWTQRHLTRCQTPR